MPASEITATSVVPAADIDDHRAGRLGHRQPGADGGRHRLLDQEDAAGAGAQAPIPG